MQALRDSDKKTMLVVLGNVVLAMTIDDEAQ